MGDEILLRADEDIQFLLQHPEEIGQRVGFGDLGEMHGEWIREMVFGEGDYTLQAHRGSYKSSCLAVAVSLMLVLYCKQNIIFLRKTDSDVSEMLGMVSKILKSEIVKDIAKAIYKTELSITSESMTHLSTNLWTSPMGAPQLLGLGIKSSITGKHAWYVITDDICNKDDRVSRAEREKTKLQYDELQNIRNKGGRIINLGTPWHKDDVFTKMPNIHKYDCYTTGLIPEEKLQEIRESMPSFLFAANYELKHIASTDAIFTTAPMFVSNEALIRDGYAHVDAAYGGSDYTAMTCCNQTEDGTIILYGRLWHKNAGDVIDEILEEATRLQCGILYCESNGDKGFLKDTINERDDYPDVWARTYTESQNKMIKIQTYLKQAWGRIRFLTGTDREYIDQILDYTEYAEHDDAPDSAATVCRYYATYRWGSKK
ncbi:MAG: hypothetical protein IJI08_01460 [Clostridia bacterium]|nr:hypothetical protein [Clostridia bacterium]